MNLTEYEQQTSIRDINQNYVNENVPHKRRSRRSIVHEFHEHETLRFNRDQEGQSPQRRLLFTWPQRKKPFMRKKEVTLIFWGLAHSLYWLHICYMLPIGAGLALDQPPWKYTAPIPRPPCRSYIIEPDWDCV